MAELTNKKLKELLNYNPETGVFIWLVSSGNVKKGCVSGSICKTRYLRIRIFKREYLSHRLAWFYVHGVWPKEIDHVNGRRDENQILNLRSLTSSENNKNRALSKNSNSGVTGVNWDKRSQRWRATIKINSKSIHLGYFVLKADAIKKRKESEIKNGFHENHGRIS